MGHADDQEGYEESSAEERGGETGSRMERGCHGGERIEKFILWRRSGVHVVAFATG